MANRLEYIRAVERDWARVIENRDLGNLGVTQMLVWVSRLLQELLDTSAQEGGLRRRGDYEVLTLVRRAERTPPTPAEIAAELQTSPSGMTSKLDRLETEGLIERTPDPKDRRTIRINLTKEGRNRADEMFLLNLTVYDSIFAPLSGAELEAFTVSLERVLVRLEELVSVSARRPWVRS